MSLLLIFVVVLAIFCLRRFVRTKSFDAIFFRRRKEVSFSDLEPSVQRAITVSRQEAIIAAEQKLARTLSSEERHGIESITSLMMLERLCRNFTWPSTTTAEVLADLEAFAMEARRKNAA